MSSSPTCPFCKIAAAYPPISPSTPTPTSTSTSTSTSSSPPENAPVSSDSDSHAFLILSTRHVLAFLDTMPLTRGHILVVPRDHYEKLGEVGVHVSREKL
ncbi:hypothetical protein P175DRAFT_0366718 [Aspergillus ochraceoroseus IBT 24754]|uniref:HIT domain-containing protein n=1 Tax=Aspergillus ochraceoroseus IBT 24754 TaxID=1392256 RepID=A0A2T5LQ01_9EURO|nr:uncharacterized protein P175DRAFT_0366718 [Aspergillus ochraceoroseus IBT 24754]PTU18364.1 hypothetical protein P175DRAFT_0366718 [Aspergillus ochraceoroseus IBT 24754]